jgi:hypothetical protein
MQYREFVLPSHRAKENRMLFWPIVIALGPGFVALYYDHDVKSFAEQSVCEQTLPQLKERARQAKEFTSALSEAAGDRLRQVTLQLVCIDKTPQQFQQDLEEQRHDKT